MDEKRPAHSGKDSMPVLVLNFANSVHPGGGVRHGAKAQEEDLCRNSTLLWSLESEVAESYYEYNKKLETQMGSDALIFTPKVEVFRDDKGAFLRDSKIVSVLTVAAPNISHGLEGMSREQYLDLLYNRIVGMLKSAAFFGYQYLIPGAWGCGVFENDAHVVSDLFRKALKELVKVMILFPGNESAIIPAIN